MLEVGEEVEDPDEGGIVEDAVEKRELYQTGRTDLDDVQDGGMAVEDDIILFLVVPVSHNRMRDREDLERRGVGNVEETNRGRWVV